MALEQPIDNDTILVSNANGKVQACQVLTAIANPAASQTNSLVQAGTANCELRVLALVAQAGGTATNITFQTTSTHAALSPVFQNGVNGGVVLPMNAKGWFKTLSGDGLEVTTGAGSATGILVKYIVVSLV